MLVDFIKALQAGKSEVDLIELALTLFQEDERGLSSEDADKIRNLIRDIQNPPELPLKPGFSKAKDEQEYQAIFYAKLYQAILPLCQLAYLYEKNGIAEEHAFKLAVMFKNKKDVLAYLIDANKNNYKNLIHDACLFQLPAVETKDMQYWKQIANLSNNMHSKAFTNLLPFLGELEKLLFQESSGKFEEERFKLIDSKKSELSVCLKAYEKVKSKPVLNPNDEQKEERRSYLSKLSMQRIQLSKELVELCKGIDKNINNIRKNRILDLVVFQAAYAVYQDSLQSYKTLVHYGISPKNIERFNNLKRTNDDTLVPNIFIDGSEIGYEGCRLVKLDTLSDEGAAIAACLGMITPCCQYLGGVGDSCAVHGIESPYGGFYVIYKREEIIASAWAWRGKNNGLCLDSVEVSEDGESETLVIVDMYRFLGFKLCQMNLVPYVTIGTQSGISYEVGVNNYPSPIEYPKDYDGYRDSESQYLLSNNTPYFLYGLVNSSQFQGIIKNAVMSFLDDILSIQTYFKSNNKLLEMIVFAIIQRNSELLDLIREFVKGKFANRLTEVEAVIKSNSSFVEGLNEQKINIKELENGVVYINVINQNRQSALHIAFINSDRNAVNKLIKLKINLNIQDKWGYSVLILALRNMNFSSRKEMRRELAYTLIINGANLDLKDKDGDSALILAVKNNDYSMVEKLVEAGADIEIEDADAKTPAYWAVEYGYLEIFIYLLSKKAKVVDVVSGKDKLSMLMVCVSEDIMKHLINAIPPEKRAAAILACDGDKYPVLYYAIKSGNKGVVDVLLSGLATAEERRAAILSYLFDGTLGINGLLSHAQSGVVEVLLAYLTAEEKVEVILTHKEDGDSAWHSAARSERFDILEVFFNNLSDKDKVMAILACDDKGNTVTISLDFFKSKLMSIPKIGFINFFSKELLDGYFESIMNMNFFKIFYAYMCEINLVHNMPFERFLKSKILKDVDSSVVNKIYNSSSGANPFFHLFHEQDLLSVLFLVDLENNLLFIDHFKSIEINSRYNALLSLSNYYGSLECLEIRARMKPNYIEDHHEFDKFRSSRMSNLIAEVIFLLPDEHRAKFIIQHFKNINFSNWLNELKVFPKKWMKGEAHVLRWLCDFYSILAGRGQEGITPSEYVNQSGFKNLKTAEAVMYIANVLQRCQSNFINFNDATDNPDSSNELYVTKFNLLVELVCLMKRKDSNFSQKILAEWFDTNKETLKKRGSRASNTGIFSRPPQAKTQEVIAKVCEIFGFMDITKPQPQPQPKDLVAYGRGAKRKR